MDASQEMAPGSAGDSVMIVGLGNPGAGYAATRHNVGFMVADEIFSGLRLRAWSRMGRFDYARATDSGVTVHLVKPLTFMNLSGTAAKEAMAMTGSPVERTLVVLDDFQLPLGAIRIRPGGSDGGHRGLASVIDALGTEMVPRLRCGIGRDVLPAKDHRREFVLEDFSGEESHPAREMILRAASAARAFGISGIGRAMTVYNTT